MASSPIFPAAATKPVFPRPPANSPNMLSMHTRTGVRGEALTSTQVAEKLLLQLWLGARGHLTCYEALPCSMWIHPADCIGHFFVQATGPDLTFVASCTEHADRTFRWKKSGGLVTIPSEAAALRGMQLRQQIIAGYRVSPPQAASPPPAPAPSGSSSAGAPGNPAAAAAPLTTSSPTADSGAGGAAAEYSCFAYSLCARTTGEQVGPYLIQVRVASKASSKSAVALLGGPAALTAGSSGLCTPRSAVSLLPATASGAAAVAESPECLSAASYLAAQTSQLRKQQQAHQLQTPPQDASRAATGSPPGTLRVRVHVRLSPEAAAASTPGRASPPSGAAAAAAAAAGGAPCFLPFLTAMYVLHGLPRYQIVPPPPFLRASSAPVTPVLRACAAPAATAAAASPAAAAVTPRTAGGSCVGPSSAPSFAAAGAAAPLQATKTPLRRGASADSLLFSGVQRSSLEPLRAATAAASGGGLVGCFSPALDASGFLPIVRQFAEMPAALVTSPRLERRPSDPGFGAWGFPPAPPRRSHAVASPPGAPDSAYSPAPCARGSSRRKAAAAPSPSSSPSPSPSPLPSAREGRGPSSEGRPPSRRRRSAHRSPASPGDDGEYEDDDDAEIPSPGGATLQVRRPRKHPRFEATPVSMFLTHLRANLAQQQAAQQAAQAAQQQQNPQQYDTGSSSAEPADPSATEFQLHSPSATPAPTPRHMLAGAAGAADPLPPASRVRLRKVGSGRYAAIPAGSHAALVPGGPQAGAGFGSSSAGHLSLQQQQLMHHQLQQLLLRQHHLQQQHQQQHLQLSPSWSVSGIATTQFSAAAVGQYWPESQAQSACQSVPGAPVPWAAPAAAANAVAPAFTDCGVLAWPQSSSSFHTSGGGLSGGSFEPSGAWSSIAATSPPQGQLVPAAPSLSFSSRPHAAGHRFATRQLVQQQQLAQQQQQQLMQALPSQLEGLPDAPFPFIGPAFTALPSDTSQDAGGRSQGGGLHGASRGSGGGGGHHVRPPALIPGLLDYDYDDDCFVVGGGCGAFAEVGECVPAQEESSAGQQLQLPHPHLQQHSPTDHDEAAADGNGSTGGHALSRAEQQLLAESLADADDS